MKDVFDIIAERNFDQLNQEEQSLVAEVCANEDEFLQMKQVLLQVADMNAVQQEAPSPKVKASLDDIFAAQNFPKTAPIWYNKLWVAVYPQDKKMYQRPLIQVAAVLLLIVGILPMMMNTDFETAPSIAKLEKPVQESKKEETLVTENDEVKSREKSEGELSKSETILEEQEMNVAEDMRTDQPNSFFTDKDRLETYRSKSAEPSIAPMTSMAEAKSLINHPDGVFNGGITVSDKYSVTVSEQPEILDLLTATF